MADSRVNEHTRLSLPVALAISVLASAVVGTVSATSTAYGFRDRALDQIYRLIDKGMTEVREEMHEELTHYLTREAFIEWKQQERIRSDRQHYELLNAIHRLSAKVR